MGNWGDTMEEDQQVMLGSDDEANGGAKEKHEMPKFTNREPNVAWLVKTNIFFWINNA